MHGCRALIAAAMLTSLAPGLAHAEDPATCAKVRMAEPGWNDLTFTTGVASVLLDALGYKASSDTLGIEVIYAGLKRQDLDVFLGYWDPAMVAYYKPVQEDGSVETVHRNLTGAKYTFAVPAYVYDAGVKDIGDLHTFSDKFGDKMYGIEPGSNQLAMDIIKDPAFHLDGWKVVESSEQGMLSEVERKTRRKEWIVFQGWQPHPMNNRFDMRYLTGGDKFYGANFGAAIVSTQVRKGYMTTCPNVGRLLQNLTFDIPFENKGMGFLIDGGLDPLAAATKAIKEEPARLDAWLAGVTTLDGKDGLAAVKAKLGL